MAIQTKSMLKCMRCMCVCMCACIYVHEQENSKKMHVHSVLQNKRAIFKKILQKKEKKISARYS